MSDNECEVKKSTKKAITTKVDEDVHRKFRSQLFLAGVTMSNFLAEVIEDYVSDRE